MITPDWPAVGDVAVLSPNFNIIVWGILLGILILLIALFAVKKNKASKK